MAAARYIEHDMRDFAVSPAPRNKGKARKAIAEEDAALHAALRLSLQRIVREAPPAEAAKSRDFSVYTGGAGRLRAPMYPSRGDPAGGDSTSTGSAMIIVSRLPGQVFCCLWSRISTVTARYVQVRANPSVVAEDTCWVFRLRSGKNFEFLVKDPPRGTCSYLPGVPVCFFFHFVRR